MSTKVECFDFTNPPPGHWRHGVSMGADYLVCQGHGKPRRLSEAWARWKAKRDPPGMFVAERSATYTRPSPTWVWGVVLEHAGKKYSVMFFADPSDEATARASAWVWYARRSQLARVAGVPDDIWPMALVWTDDQCEKRDA